MINGWSVAKDFIGFIGALAASVPWFRDFWGRIRLSRIRDVDVDHSLCRLKEDIEDSVENWLAKPKLSDLGWTLAGLALVAMSFLIGLVQTLSG